MYSVQRRVSCCHLEQNGTIGSGVARQRFAGASRFDLRCLRRQLVCVAQLLLRRCGLRWRMGRGRSCGRWRVRSTRSHRGYYQRRDRYCGRDCDSDRQPWACTRCGLREIRSRPTPRRRRDRSPFTMVRMRFSHRISSQCRPHATPRKCSRRPSLSSIVEQATKRQAIHGAALDASTYCRKPGALATSGTANQAQWSIIPALRWSPSTAHLLHRGILRVDVVHLRVENGIVALQRTSHSRGLGVCRCQCQGGSSVTRRERGSCIHCLFKHYCGVDASHTRRCPIVSICLYLDGARGQLVRVTQLLMCCISLLSRVRRCR